RGYDLVLLARETDRLQVTADALAAAHQVEVTVLGADLATRDGLARATDAIARRRIDLLVNNAGSSLGRTFGETAIEDEEFQLDLLLRAPLVLCDAALKAMLAAGGGRIV